MRRALPVLILFFAALGPRAAWAQGNPLGPEFRVNTYTFGTQAHPAVATDSLGNFVVVWYSQLQDGSYGVYAQRYASSGGTLGPEFRVNTWITNNQRYPSVASAFTGDFVVAWESLNQDGSSNGIFGQRYASAGSPLGLEFRVNTFTLGSQTSPSVASDPAGTFVVVWVHENDGSSFGVFGQRYASSGVPLGPEFRVNTYITGGQSGPSVAASAGSIIVVWGSIQDGSSAGVYGQRYASSGAPLGPEFRVNTYTPSVQQHPSVAAAPAGDFVVVWASIQDGSGYGVFGQRYASSGAAVGPEFRVNTQTTGAQRHVAVDVDTGGEFVVTWDSYPQDGSGGGTFGQRYDSSGAPLGPEFRVNTYTPNTQYYPSVAADSSGDFVVVWQSTGQDGSGIGVFGQRYSQIFPVELMGFGVE